MSASAWSRPLPLAATFGVAALTSAYGGMIFQGTVRHAAPLLAPSLLATAPLFYLLLTHRGGRRDPRGPRTFAPTAVITAVAAPIFAGLAHLALAVPLAKALGGRDADFIAAAKVFGVASASGILMASAVATWMQARARSRIAWVIAVAAPAALLVALALVIAGAASPRVRPHEYVASLPIAGRTPPSLPVSGEDVTEVGDVAVTRRCVKVLCDVWVTRRGEAPAPGTRPDFHPPDPEVIIRRDAAHDLWIVAVGDRDYASFPLDDEPARWAAYRGPEALRTEVRPRHLLGALAPPRDWIVTAAIGALIAAALLSRRRSAKRALREILAAEAGTIDEGGFITLDRTGQVVRAATAGVAPGPVLVLDADALAGAYRTAAAGTADRVVAGTRDALVAAARQAITTLDARALATVLVSAAPLATAWLEGLR